MIEHRQRTRRRAFAMVELKERNKHVFTGLVYNVCIDGMYILSTYDPELNNVVDVCNLTSGKDERSFQATGVVVHRGINGFGLMFCEKENYCQPLVDELLSSYSGSAPA